MVGQERGQASHSPSEPPQTAVVPEPWSHTPSHLVTGVACHCVQTKLHWRKQVFCQVTGASPSPSCTMLSSQEHSHAASVPGGYGPSPAGWPREGHLPPSESKDARGAFSLGNETSHVKSTVEWELHWRPGTEPWQAGLGSQAASIP